MKRLREMDLFGLEKRRLRVELIAVIMDGYRADGAKLFLEICCERLRNNGHNLLQGKF